MASRNRLRWILLFGGLLTLSTADCAKRAPSRPPTSPVHRLEAGEFVAKGGAAYAAAISPDGSMLAVVLYATVEVYDLTTNADRPRLLQSYQVDAHSAVRWHPTRKLIAAVSETGDISLLNVTMGKASFVHYSYPPTHMTWAGDSDRILVSYSVSHDAPGIHLFLINVWDGKETPMPQDDPKHLIYGNGVWFKDGRYAAALPGFHYDQSIEFYRKRLGVWKWDKIGSIPSAAHSTSQTTAILDPLVWLDNGRLAYVLVRLDTNHRREAVEVWTCSRNGSDRQEWLAFPSIKPPPSGISISTNKKRIAYFRGNRLFVFDVQDWLAKGQGLPLGSGELSPGNGRSRGCSGSEAG